MTNKNLLIGYGETLVSPVTLKHGGGDKRYPYEFQAIRPRLSTLIDAAADQVGTANPATVPHGEAVVEVTLHPAFLAKSYFPRQLLNEFDLRHVGSKGRFIRPQVSLRKDPPEGGESAPVLFVAGTQSSLRALEGGLWSERLPAAFRDDYRKIEDFQVSGAAGKIRQIGDGKADEHVDLEVVLHAGTHQSYVLDGFVSWASQCGAEVLIDKAIYVPMLTFVPVRIARSQIDALAEYSFVRVVRRIAPLRVHRPVVVRAATVEQTVSVPSEAAINSDMSVALFDGGIGHDRLQKWVDEYTWPDTKGTTAKLLMHGNAVTSTVLFGEASSSEGELPRPYAKVRHYRVIGKANGGDPDLFDVLHKIDWVLVNDQPQFANLSLGPCLPIDDDDVHVWTTLLDHRLSNGRTFATVAVGNDGDDADPAMCRVQPPSDMVNAIGVGAANSSGNTWDRAAYSCIGPGRSPGLMKPDGVAFGGSASEPFHVYDPGQEEVIGVEGTSFAAPHVLRAAIGVAASLEAPLSSTALRALLIHRAEQHPTSGGRQVGWGRFETDPARLIRCADNEAMVIYQGVINPGQPVRAKIPFPDIPFNGKVTVQATFAFTTPTDPAHSLNYTKAGLTVVFRPVEAAKKTLPFFNQDSFDSEDDLRRDAQKWEACLSRMRRFNPSTLKDPVFDIEYLTREEGRAMPAKDQVPLPYVLVVTLSVAGTPEVYNSVLQKYKTLQPVKLATQVHIRT
ncbi:S8 family peptidase [Paraburkholderia acidiphila]|uniref:S8 family serine peptidase n=1 Tax=Paraburkholderia acidiphila TaxID=2571747 RepID=A0A7Z2G789_9BURK|nr:S8 family peptidase [Paraburkholderia acidiphila]QGZ56369.1 S8 family serine peptidase [Paraburkholderia acidiphila]